MIEQLIFLGVAIFAVLRIATILDSTAERKRREQINRRAFRYRK